jgi:hypothetical protein
VSFALSDLLEERQLRTAVQVGGASRSDFAVQTAYFNRQSRWNWGVAATQIPVLIGAARAPSASESPSTPTVTREIDLLHQTHRQAAGVAMYPFSRARRIELSGGLHAITSEREVATRVYARGSGALLTTSQDPAPGEGAVTLLDTSAALVYDTSIFGGTGPLLGTRYRLEAAPTLGDLSYTTVIADYRRYVMPMQPVTVAFRVQHVGRYGAAAGDSRLLPLVWTLRDLVRGYDAQDVMTTRRLALTNVEARVPLVGAFGRLSRATVLPLDAIAFADAGAFWFGTTAASASPTILRSAGAGVRLNAAGFIFEVAAARALDSTSPGWRLSFNFLPGF